MNSATLHPGHAVPPWGIPGGPTEPLLVRFTPHQFAQLQTAGILSEDDRYELLDGLVVHQMPPNPPHAMCTHRLTRLLLALFSDPEWYVGIQSPVSLPDSVPMPDLFVARGPDTRYASRHPGPKDLVLVIEVADTSLDVDMNTKLPMYARGRVPQVWVVDLKNRRVQVFSQPRGGKTPGYKQHAIHAEREQVPVIVDDHPRGSLAVRDLLP